MMAKTPGHKRPMEDGGDPMSEVFRSDLTRARRWLARLKAGGAIELAGEFKLVRADERAKFESVGVQEKPDLSSHQAHMDWMRRARSVAAGPFKTPKDRRTMDSDHEEILLAIKGLGVRTDPIDRLDAAALAENMKQERRRVERLDRDAELGQVAAHVDPAAEGADRAGYVQVEPLQKPVPYETTTVAAEEDEVVDWQMPPPEPEAPFMEGLAVALEKHAEQLEEEVRSLDSLLARLGTAARLPRKAPLPERSEVRADSLFVRLGALRWRIDAALSDLRTLVVIFEKEVG